MWMLNQLKTFHSGDLIALVSFIAKKEKMTHKYSCWKKETFGWKRWQPNSFCLLMETISVSLMNWLKVCEY